MVRGLALSNVGMVLVLSLMVFCFTHLRRVNISLLPLYVVWSLKNTYLSTLVDGIVQRKVPDGWCWD